MTEIDWIIAVVLVISTIVGIMRGVVREVLAIVGWVAGIMLAMSFAGEIAEKIPFERVSATFRASSLRPWSFSSPVFSPSVFSA